MGDAEMSAGSSVMLSPRPSCILDVSTGRLSTGQGVLERGGVARGGSGKWPSSSSVISGTGDFDFEFSASAISACSSPCTCARPKSDEIDLFALSPSNDALLFLRRTEGISGAGVAGDDMELLSTNGGKQNAVSTPSCRLGLLDEYTLPRGLDAFLRKSMACSIGVTGALLPAPGLVP